MGGRIIGFLAGVSTVGLVHHFTKGLFAFNLFLHDNITSMTDQVNNQILSDRGIDKNPIPPNRRVNILYRPSLVETCKDIWNEELINSVNWLYSINWYQWGLDIDRKLNKITDKFTQKLTNIENEKTK